MTGNRLVDQSQSQSSAKGRRGARDIPKAQETLYSYLLEIVKEWEPDAVLEEFKRLFIHHINTASSHTLPSLYEIVFANQEQEFRNTLKRCCYILINNWDLKRHHKSIQQLIALFDDPIVDRGTMSPTLQRLRNWLKAFVKSKDFQELQLFAARYDTRETTHWSERYASYLLVPQYIDLNNPIEQRQAARTLSRQLKEQFKFDLAMYTARSGMVTGKDKQLKNPTALGDEVLRLIKAMIARRGVFNYNNIANIFVKQIQNLTYQEFKQSLKKYLLFSVEQGEYTYPLKTELSKKLDQLYTNHHDRTIDDALLLRTCNRVIDYLTTENRREPSALFIHLLSQGNPLTLVIVLIKLILICKYARTHLEARIAELIMYYQACPEEECKWVVNFFEIFRIITAIYTENVEFNLVSMKPTTVASASPSNSLPKPQESFRIFSQHKQLSEQEQSASDQEEELELMDSSSSEG